MPLVSVKSIRRDLPSSIPCKQVSPVVGSTRNLRELKTVGMTLTRAQMKALCRVLRAAQQNWPQAYVTIYRRDKRITVTTHA